MNTNTRLRNLAIRHGVYLDRYTRAQALEMRKILTAAASEIEAKIRAANGEWTKGRLRAMVTEVRAILGESFDVAKAKLDTIMRELAEYEVEYGSKDLRKAIPVEFNTTTPDPEQVYSSLNSLPAAGGMLMSELFTKWGSDTTDAFVGQIRLGVLQGETVDQMVRRIHGDLVTRAAKGRPAVYEGGVLETTKRAAETLVRTAVAHVNAQAREAIYAANDDLIKGYQYVAALDTITCLICGPLDGKEYTKDETRPSVPQHYNCRCAYVPITKSFKEMGIDLEEV